MALPNTCVAYTNAANTILFAFFNQKKYYKRKYQPLFLKIRDWAMLRFYKGYSIPSLGEVARKLTLQYMGPFQIKKR